jgi:hypothetical protein
MQPTERGPAERPGTPGSTAVWAVYRSGVLYRVASTVFTGVVCGLLSVIMSIGAASLVVASQPSSYFPSLIGVALL